MNAMIKICKFPKSIDEVKNFDQAYTIIVLTEADVELLKQLNTIGFYYIFISKEEDYASVELDINNLSDEISKNPDQYYEIEKFNSEFANIIKDKNIPTAINALDKLLTSIKSFEKETFLKVVKYSLDDIIAVKDEIKRLMNGAIEDTSYTLLYHNALNKNQELNRDIASMNIKCATLEKQNEELVKIPELIEKLNNAEEENKNLFNRVNELESNRNPVDSKEIEDLKYQIGSLKEIIENLTVQNKEYKNALDENISKDSTAKDILIESLKEELEKVRSYSSNNVEDVASCLPILSPNKIALPNTSNIIYIKEVREMSYFDAMMRYMALYLIKLQKNNSSVLVIVYDKMDNDFRVSKYKGNKNKFFDLEKVNIHFTNNLTFNFVKGLNISSYRNIMIIDRLGVDKDIIVDYPDIRKYFTIKSVDDIDDFKLPADNCIKEFFDKTPGINICKSAPEDLGSKDYRIRNMALKGSQFEEKILKTLD
jgi:regulator of replication initiation timing